MSRQLTLYFNGPNNIIEGIFAEKCQKQLEAYLTKGLKKKKNQQESKEVIQNKMLANVKFVGELYKQNMMTEKIVHSFIQKLFNQKTLQDCDIEALCVLLTSLGSKIKQVEAKEQIAQDFKRLKALSTTNSFSPRIHLMLQNLFELQKNKWVPLKVRVLNNNNNNNNSNNNLEAISVFLSPEKIVTPKQNKTQHQQLQLRPQSPQPRQRLQQHLKLKQIYIPNKK
eukprot:TRINITY_DN6657_c0_g3_i1.p1 TRINITY_DN6657_c0_g3~~TRINITY_DN6657_c0_g3_i1.p1  ORF type:complete len:225 (+),score=51.18 TRINITY_DN6657_c0_g3_i1:320-994(+)